MFIRLAAVVLLGIVGCGDDTAHPTSDSGLDAEIDAGAADSGAGEDDRGGTGGTSGTSGTGGTSGASGTGGAGDTVTKQFSIGGSITDLTGAGLTIENHSEALTLASGTTAFTFQTSVESGTSYLVTIISQPAGQTCFVEQGAGVVGAGDVTDIEITCVSASVLAVEASFGSAIARWTDTGATRYVLTRTSARACIPTTTTCPDYAEYDDVSSPFTCGGLENGKGYYFRLIARHGSAFEQPSNWAGTRPNRPHFNGDVAALAVASDVTYVGGDFDRLGVYTGSAVPVDYATGAMAPPLHFPIVEGEVLVVTNDSSGGYFIGGRFSRVGGVTRKNLAHVDGNGALDLTWDPAPDGPVELLLSRTDGKLYVAGSFDTIAGVSRTGLAGFGANGVITTWTPEPNGAISALMITGTGIVVGGEFTQIVAQARNRLARFDDTDALTTWAPDPDGDVSALMVQGDSMVVAGDFENIGGAERHYLAEIDAAGLATDFDPQPNDRVTTLGFSFDALYFAGEFTMVGASARAGLAAVTREGELTRWNPTPDAVSSVRAIVRPITSDSSQRDTVYLGGTFTRIGGQLRRGAAAVSGIDTGELTGWNPDPDGPVASIAFTDSAVVLGGEFGGLRGVERRRLAALRPDDTVTDWNPGANARVRALATRDNWLYVGGAFTELGGQIRNRIGQFDASGALRPWDPNADADVYAIALGSGAVYVGGAFTNIGGAARSRLAVLNSLGEADPWAANVNGTVRTLAVDEPTIYAGGDFSQIDSDARSYIAALSWGASPPVEPWDPGADGPVSAIAIGSSAIYAAGSFTDIGGESRDGLAALDATSGDATPWNPEPNAAVGALAVDDSTLYVAGAFDAISGEARRGLAAYDDSLELFDAYHPDPGGEIVTLAIRPDAVVAGGSVERRVVQLSKVEE